MWLFNERKLFNTIYKHFFLLLFRLLTITYSNNKYHTLNVTTAEVCSKQCVTVIARSRSTTNIAKTAGSIFKFYVVTHTLFQRMVSIQTLIIYNIVKSHCILNTLQKCSLSIKYDCQRKKNNCKEQNATSTHCQGRMGQVNWESHQRFFV